MNTTQTYNLILKRMTRGVNWANIRRTPLSHPRRSIVILQDPLLTWNGRGIWYTSPLGVKSWICFLRSKKLKVKLQKKSVQSVSMCRGIVTIRILFCRNPFDESDSEEEEEIEDNEKKKKKKKVMV